MLLLAFSVTNPEGSVLDETVHILSRHFDEHRECTQFIENWGDTIRNRGPRQVSELLKEGFEVKLTDVRCVPTPPKPKPVEEDEPEPEQLHSEDAHS